MNSESGGGGDDRIWVVDRIESGIAVLVRDDDALQKDVPVAVLPPGTQEGAVLRIPEVRGRPVWSHAVADEEMRMERLRKAEAVLRRLRRRDPGGDVLL